VGLARVYTNIGSLIIRKLGDTGGPSSLRVDEELNRIIAWAKDAKRCIHRDTTAVGNVGAGLDSLHSFSVVAATLATDGDYIDVFYRGFFAANDNNKRLVFSFGGTAFLDTGSTDVDGSASNFLWSGRVMIIRLTSTTVRATGMLWAQFFGTDSAAAPFTGGGGYSLVQGTGLTVSNLNSNANTLLVQGESLAGVTDDVVQNATIIELVQQ
jgi:hypothetical protein